MPDYSDTRIQLRRGTSSEFNAANPTLGVGEPAYDTTENFIKVGDGTKNWNNLPNHVISDTTDLIATKVHNVVLMSTANYNNLVSAGNTDPNTLYFVT
jgi:hypothetical protein